MTLTEGENIGGILPIATLLLPQIASVLPARSMVLTEHLLFLFLLDLPVFDDTN